MRSLSHPLKDWRDRVTYQKPHDVKQGAIPILQGLKEFTTDDVGSVNVSSKYFLRDFLSTLIKMVIAFLLIHRKRKTLMISLPFFHRLARIKLNKLLEWLKQLISFLNYVMEYQSLQLAPCFLL